MKRKEKENYIFNLIYQFVSIAYPIILTPYTARIFDADGIGKYSYTVAINTLFTLVLICMGRYGFREVSYNQNNAKEKSKTFWEIFSLKTIVFIILIIGYILLILFSSNEYHNLYIAQIISLLYAWIEIGWFWQGNENFKITASISVINKIILLFSVFAFVKTKSDLVLYAFLVSLITFLGSMSMWIPLRKQISKPVKLNLKKHVKSCILICIPFIIIELYSSVDKAMIGIITGNNFENGYYEQTVKITKMVMVILTSMSLIKAPRHTNLAKEGSYNELEDSLYESFSFMILLGAPITMGLCAVANRCVPLFLGDGYDCVIYLMYWYAPFMMLHGFVDILANQYFIPIKRQNIYTISVSISCLVNIILNVVLIKIYGSLGAIIATVLSELVSCMILISFAKEAFNIKKVVKENYKYIIASLIMFIVCFSVGKIIKFNLLIDIFIQVLIGVVIYFFSLIILRPKYFTQNFNKVATKIKNNIIREGQ